MLGLLPLLEGAAAPGWLHYLPLVTTAVAVPFAVSLFRRYAARGGRHLFWWGLGVVCYGTGTALESTITLAGNSAELTKAWYVAGALLGAYPLAQGTVHLLARERTARRLTRATLPVVAVLAVLVLASPVDAAAVEPHRPTGDVLAWTWVRSLTPLVNLYAAGFLVGGAALSAWRFARARTARHRAVGNVLIAVGALLPAIGGGMAKGGLVEALYVAELVGLVLIGLGFRACTRGPGTAGAGARVTSSSSGPGPRTR